MLNKHVWDMLGKSTRHSTGVVALRLHPESKFNVFAALEEATGHRFLLLKSNQPDVRPAQPLPSGRGFNVQFVITASDPEGANCLRFELTEPTHSDVFDVIGNDVLRNIVQSADDKAAFGTFAARIDEWQHFLDQLPGEGFSEQAQQGLFAELWFLRALLVAEVGPLKAVRAWAGPKALAKDFQLSGVAFEVKASSSKQHSRFSISSEMQLDLHGVSRLILYCLLLERLVAGGMSLPELVAAVRTDLKSDLDAALLFSELLLETGYTDADARHYTTRFALRSQHFFDVRDNFPRIVEADLRPGVGDVHYSILYSECERYAVTEAEARNLIRATLP
jgi:hypothetical protein